MIFPLVLRFASHRNIFFGFFEFNVSVRVSLMKWISKRVIGTAWNGSWFMTNCYFLFCSNRIPNPLYPKVFRNSFFFHRPCHCQLVKLIFGLFNTISSINRCSIWNDSLIHFFEKEFSLSPNKNFPFTDTKRKFHFNWPIRESFCFSFIFSCHVCWHDNFKRKAKTKRKNIIHKVNYAHTVMAVNYSRASTTTNIKDQKCLQLADVCLFKLLVFSSVVYTSGSTNHRLKA